MADSKAASRKLQGEPGTSCAKKWESAPKNYGDTLKKHRKQHEGVFHWPNLGGGKMEHQNE